MTYEKFASLQSRRRFLQQRRIWDRADGSPASSRRGRFCASGRSSGCEIGTAPGEGEERHFLFMSGGPSQLDLFDHKPQLQKWHGQSLPASLTKDLQLAFVKPTAAVMASPRQFSPPAIPGTSFRICFRTRPRARTTSACFERCTPTRSTMTPAKCC